MLALEVNAIRILLLAVLAVGCGPNLNAEGSGETEATSTGAGTDASGSTTTPSASTTGASSTTATVTGAGGSSSEDGIGFIPMPDACEKCDCDTYVQDCPPGEKCADFANDGGTGWNDTRCIPVPDNPSAVGAPCVVEDFLASGIDDCDKGAFCWYLDRETLEGQCVPLCGGSAANPTCPEGYSCIESGSAPSLCLPVCHPLEEPCPGGQACLPVYGVFFVCVGAATDPQPYGAECHFFNGCEPGLVCVGSNDVDCDADACCGAFCDLDDREPNPSCPDAATGQTCVPWFDEGRAPDGHANVGLCSP